MNKFDYLRNEEMKKNIKITRSMFENLMTKSPFSSYMAVGEPFGRLGELNSHVEILLTVFLFPIAK